MAYQLLYFDEVLTDIQEAKAWYKEKRDGLEDEFALAVETALERIDPKFIYDYRFRTQMVTG